MLKVNKNIKKELSHQKLVSNYSKTILQYY